MIPPGNNTESADNPLGKDKADATMNSLHDIDLPQDLDTLTETDQTHSIDKDHYMDVSPPSSPLTVFPDDGPEVDDAVATTAMESKTKVRRSSRQHVPRSLHQNTVPRLVEESHNYDSPFKDFGSAANPIDLTDLTPRRVGDSMVEVIDLTADSVCSACYLVPRMITKYVEVRRSLLSQLLPQSFSMSQSWNFRSRRYSSMPMAKSSDQLSPCTYVRPLLF